MPGVWKNKDMKTTIKVGSNGLRLDVHNGRDPHLELRRGRLRPALRLDSDDLVHLAGLLTVASGGDLAELVATDAVLNGRTIDCQRDGS